MVKPFPDCQQFPAFSLLKNHLCTQVKLWGIQSLPGSTEATYGRFINSNKEETFSGTEINTQKILTSSLGYCTSAAPCFLFV
jgi:hypothetical protein